jgi:hypothetical protein
MAFLDLGEEFDGALELGLVRPVDKRSHLLRRDLAVACEAVHQVPDDGAKGDDFSEQGLRDGGSGGMAGNPHQDVATPLGKGFAFSLGKSLKARKILLTDFHSNGFTALKGFGHESGPPNQRPSETTSSQMETGSCDNVSGDTIWYRALCNDNKANDYHLVSERCQTAPFQG